MRWLLSLLLPMLTAAHAVELPICYNYDCATREYFSLSRTDLIQLGALFRGLKSPAAERTSIGLAIGFLNTLAGAQTPVHNDRGGNFDDDGVDGRMDCIDHATTATGYLQFLQQRGLMRMHTVGDPVYRAPYIVNDHWAASVRDKHSGEEYAVDAWFFDNGHPAAVVPLPAWVKGWEPE